MFTLIMESIGRQGIRKSFTRKERIYFDNFEFLKIIKEIMLTEKQEARRKQFEKYYET